MTFTLNKFDLTKFIQETLTEDMDGPPYSGGRDITSESVIPADAIFSGIMDSRDEAVICGLPIAEAFFHTLDPDCNITILVEEGSTVSAGANIMELRGNARALLTAERSALNTVQHLSGISTMTAQYVERIAGTGCTLLDTRKTIPGLRYLEKYAVRMGGGANHRMGLYDAAMIKDNHIAVAGSIGEAVRRAVAADIQNIIVEVDRLDQIEDAVTAGGTHILLDNMAPDTLREAVAIIAGRAKAEASGGINLDTIHAKANTGVDFVSVGRLTQSAPAADIGLDFEQI